MAYSKPKTLAKSARLRAFMAGRPHLRLSVRAAQYSYNVRISMLVGSINFFLQSLFLSDKEISKRV